MIIGGLDIATLTGAAVMKDGVITTESLSYSGRKKKFLDDDQKDALDAIELGKVFAWFEAAITIWLIEHKVEHVAIEEPLRTDFKPKKTEIVDQTASWAGRAVRYEEKKGGTNLKTIFKIHGLEAIACAVCARFNVPVVFVNQGTWRKAFLGNGRPSKPKQDAKLQCIRLGIEAVTLDSAEAAGIVWWLDQHLNPYSHRRANDLFAPKTISAKDYRAEAEKHFKTAG